MVDVTPDQKKAKHARNKESVLAALRLQDDRKVSGTYSQIRLQLGLQGEMSTAELRCALGSLTSKRRTNCHTNGRWDGRRVYWI